MLGSQNGRTLIGFVRGFGTWRLKKRRLGQAAQPAPAAPAEPLDSREYGL